jgi:hypothetical protein
MMRDIQWVLGVLLVFCCLLWIGIVTGAGALPVLNSSGLSWDTESAMHWQAQRADLAKVRAVEETKRTIAWQETLRTFGIVGGAAAVLIVLATQWGRTARHREEQYTERVRLCTAYVASRYLPGDDVEVRQVRGPWWPLTPKRVEVVDHGAQEIVPVAVIEQTMQLPAVRRGGY